MAAALGGQMRASEANSRTFALAVLVSIVAHALLLFIAPGLRESKRPAAAPGPIVARLVQPRVPSAPAPQPAAETQKSRLEEPSPPPPPVTQPVAAPVAKPAPVAKAAPKAQAKPAAAEPQPAAPQTAAAPPSAPQAAAPASTPAPAPGPVARTEPQPTAPAPSADMDTGSLRQYHAQLIFTAKKYKRYPRVAMDNNLEGAAEVLMVIGANGMISSIRIKSSSGHEILDQQAIEMFKKTKPLVPIPAALRGKEFSLVLKAVYSLKEPDA